MEVRLINGDLSSFPEQHDYPVPSAAIEESQEIPLTLPTYWQLMLLVHAAKVSGPAFQEIHTIFFADYPEQVDRL